MAKYITSQRKKLIDFFNDNPDRQFTVKEITASLNDRSISQSAIYRNLVAMEEENMILRTVKEGSRECYFQYTYIESCQNCIHMTCVKCGKTFHVDTGIVHTMIDSVYAKNGFKIDRSKTVLYGVCDKCI